MFKMSHFRHTPGRESFPFNGN